MVASIGMDHIFDVDMAHFATDVWPKSMLASWSRVAYCYCAYCYILSSPVQLVACWVWSMLWSQTRQTAT